MAVIDLLLLQKYTALHFIRLLLSGYMKKALLSRHIKIQTIFSKAVEGSMVFELSYNSKFSHIYDQSTSLLIEKEIRESLD